MADFWNNEETISEIDKNDRGEKIIIKKCDKSGKDYVDVRTYYMKNDLLTPGKGIAIPLELAEHVANAILSGVKA